MKTLFPAPKFPTPRTAEHCRDWLSADDVVRIALGAFYAACRYYDRGEPALGVPTQNLMHDSRRVFADDLAEIFEARLMDHGLKAGAPGFTGPEIETIAWWAEETLTSRGVILLDIHRRALTPGIKVGCTYDAAVLRHPSSPLNTPNLGADPR